MSFSHNKYAVEAPESVLRESFEQVLRNQGLTDEDIARLNDIGISNVIILADVKECDLFPGNMTATDVDLSWLSDTKKCQLLRLVYLAQELTKAEYKWLTAEERYQLFLHGAVNFITVREQQLLEELMRQVEHRANHWLATYIPDAQLKKLEELIEWVRVGY
jgi:hypothetical protein